MPSEFAFNWRPGLLEWLLVLELIVLVVLALYRYIAALMGRTAPTDALVIFYHVFWRAFRSPKRYPIPVNYLPVPPREKKPKLEESGEGVGLTDDELEMLMAGGEAPRGEGQDMAAALRSAHHADLHVRVVTGMTIAVRSIEEGVVTISVNVPPDDGRANRIVIEQICTMLHLKPHQIGIHTGQTRADKSLRITGMSESELEKRLEALGEAPGETLGFVPGS